MGLERNCLVGSHVWVEDPTLAWIDGEVSKVDGKDVEIQTSDGRIVVEDMSKIFPKDMETPYVGVNDMTRLSYLHEPGVLHNLLTRYECNKIYTYTGNILIAINPFQRLPQLYDSETMEQYKGAPLGMLNPHVFAVADVAYRVMMNEGERNSILVSGESGSGKTETTKMLMCYLANLGGRVANERRTVEQQVLESNPVLEAFGNAKTVRNDNSSRFGKFVEIQFDGHGRISGAAIRTYLLERSRVCQISDPERNYHCFYRLCSAPPEEIEKYKLGNPKSYHYLNQSNCYELVGVNDAHDYLATRHAMDVVGISQEEQDAIFRVVAAILHLGNIEFEKEEVSEHAVIKDDQARFHLQMTAELLMCDPQALEDALCKRVMITREEIIKRSLDPLGAIVGRDGLAKTIYSRLFDWLVEKINFSIGQDPDSNSLIGILDIYGFESFKTNSFEQFCINFTNEKLQQHFNQHVFKMEQEEYVNEQIDWSYIDFVDNQDVLDLIEKKPGGIIALLDEACMFPKSTHETFCEKLYQTFKTHKRFIKPKLSVTSFTIAHYAGEVPYDACQFLDKNKDYVVLEHQELLSASKCSFVAGLFPPILDESTKSSKFSSIGSRFKLQLQQLMEYVNSTKPLYIRCVKPNNLLKPGIFDNVNVMQQLRCGGVLETIRISCAGYPTRRTFKEFIDRFSILCPTALEGNYDEKAVCTRILGKIGLSGFQIGETKVFLRANQMAELDAARAVILAKAAIVIQRNVRAHISQKRFVALKHASIFIQSFWRGRKDYKLYIHMKRESATIKIQKNMRRHLSRKAYTQLYLSVLVLQTQLRGSIAHHTLRLRKKSKAATRIQAQWRCHRLSSMYNKEKEASIVFQSKWRGRTARRELRQLKMAARESSALKEAKERLQRQVDELTNQLRFERRLRLDLEEASKREKSKMQHSSLAMQDNSSENNSFVAEEKGNELMDVETVGSATPEIESLKALLHLEKQRADEYEKKCIEVQKSNDEKLMTIKETEGKVDQLQKSFARMAKCFSDQILELKMILHNSSDLCSITIPSNPYASFDIDDDDQAEVVSPTFTFPIPSSTPTAVSSLTPDALRQIVQDLSPTEKSGDENNWENQRQEAFDDFF
ncbi:hypothetical protein Scep_029823 [Stephania cephalantha]|uniref:Uncharacterized protein n=1 Tax=Stephania cephalantha TaxID=152367 RepID=A0AAP0HFZ8_9MAGN